MSRQDHVKSCYSKCTGWMRSLDIKGNSQWKGSFTSTGVLTFLNDSYFRVRSPPSSTPQRCAASMLESKEPTLPFSQYSSNLSIRRRQVCHWGVLIDLQRLSFKALKTRVVAVKSVPHFAKGSSHLLSLGTATFPLGFKIYWSSLWKAEVGNANTY